MLKRNSRLSLALHTLGHMASEPETVRTSAQIAEHAGTNAVVVRRVLGKLRKAGLLVSEKGHAGGWMLARAPGEISLADVYLALDEKLVAPEIDAQPHSCSIEKTLHQRVSNIMVEVENTLVDRLSTTTIADVGHRAV
ncbi:MAG: Rrf2 family transcriptional regulator [Pseudomonadota bacterium]